MRTNPVVVKPDAAERPQMSGLLICAITSGDWSLKAWVSAHVYLGLAVMVVATLHSGFQFGWNIHTRAYGLMVLVVVSGLCGITVYDLCHLGHAPCDLVLRHGDHRRPQREGQVVAHGQVGVKRVLLEHHRELSRFGRDLR